MVCYNPRGCELQKWVSMIKIHGNCSNECSTRGNECDVVSRAQFARRPSTQRRMYPAWNKLIAMLVKALNLTYRCPACAECPGILLCPRVVDPDRLLSCFSTSSQSIWPSCFSLIEFIRPKVNECRRLMSTDDPVRRCFCELSDCVLVTGAYREVVVLDLRDVDAGVLSSATVTMNVREIPEMPTMSI